MTTLSDSIDRFIANEVRVNTFVNQTGEYLTSDNTHVETLPSFMARVSDDLDATLQRFTLPTLKGAWAAGTSYSVWDAVSNGGTWYICITAHIASSTFSTDSAKWVIYQGLTPATLFDFAPGYFATAATLRATTNPSSLKSVITLGALTSGDGGGGLWYWDANSLAADNLGTVLLPIGHVGPGRWLRAWDGAANVLWFGVDRAEGGAPADNVAAFNAALAAADEVYVPEGRYRLAGTVVVGLLRAWDPGVDYSGNSSNAILGRYPAGKTLRMSPQARLLQTIDADIIRIQGTGNVVQGGILDAQLMQGNWACGVATVSGGAVTGVSVTTPGSGQVVAPKIIFDYTLTPGAGTGARATANVINGAVTGVTVTNGGSGYSAAPSVQLYPMNYTKAAVVFDATTGYGCYYNLLDSVKIYNVFGRSGYGIKFIGSGGASTYWNNIKSCLVNGFYYGVHAASGSINDNNINVDLVNCVQGLYLTSGGGNDISGNWQVLYQDQANPNQAFAYVSTNYNKLRAMIYDYSAGHDVLCRYPYELASTAKHNLIEGVPTYSILNYQLLDSTNTSLGAINIIKKDFKIEFPMYSSGYSGATYAGYHAQVLAEVNRFYSINPLNNLLGTPRNISSITGTASNVTATASRDVATVGTAIAGHRKKATQSIAYRADSIAGGSLTIDIALTADTCVGVFGLTTFNNISWGVVTTAYVKTNAGNFIDVPRWNNATSLTPGHDYVNDILFTTETLDRSVQTAVRTIRFVLTIPSRASGATTDNGYQIFVSYLYANIGYVDSYSNGNSYSSGLPWIGGDTFYGPLNFGSDVGPGIYYGAGSPEGVVTAYVGSLYLRNDGYASSLYVKQNYNGGNTGWQVK